MTITLAGISLHPVKSTAIRPVEAAYVGAAGLVGDREWLVVDETGAMMTAREQPGLFHVVADNPATGGPADVALRLSAPDVEPLDVAEPASGDVPAKVFKRPVTARPAGPEADAWLSKVIGRDLRLMWCRRAPAERTAFQDRSAVSVATTASMAQLNTWMGEQLPVSRFRANLLLDGDLTPFAEDGWSAIRVGGALLRVEKPISRCVMTTIDAATLEKGIDPIRTLAQRRRWDGKTWFAAHLVVEQEGEIAVGDEVGTN